MADDFEARVDAQLLRTGEPRALATPSPVSIVGGSQDGNRPLPYDRDTLGRFVREAWVRWAEAQPEPKPSWLAPYDDLSEADKEADRQIGEAVARWTLIGDAASNSLKDSPCSRLVVTDAMVKAAYRTLVARNGMHIGVESIKLALEDALSAAATEGE